MSEEDGIAVFRVESQELLERIEQGLLDLEHKPGDAVLVASVFRALHTLKGSGAMFGMDDLADFVHHCETAFDRVRKGQVAASPGLVTAVLNAMDFMRALAEQRAAPADEGERLLATLHAAVGGAASGAVAEMAAGAPAAAAGAVRYRINFSLASDVFVNGTRPLPMLDELRELGPCRITAVSDNIPPLGALDPTACYLGWDVELTTDKSRAAIEDVFLFVRDDMTLRIELVEDAAAEVPPVAKAAAAEAAEAKAVRADASVRVPAVRLDELMDRVGELVIAQSRLKQIAASSADLNLRSVAEEIEHLASELRDSMMSVRMVPVAQLFSRFRRLIHDLSAETGKEIALVTEGESTELDKTVIERLADPLVHLIRNAADHGLEPAAERIAAGKASRGTITLSARQAGAEVVISVRDDGRGVNRARVRAKAEENGLLAAGAQLSDPELLNLIFQPGFSTAASITNLSGRGVGMDVVKRTIEGLRGALELTSAAGEGSKVDFRIPLTLAIIDGLLVRVANARYVIPVSAVEECLELTPAQDLRSTGRSFLTIRDALVPFVRLRELFKTGTKPDPYQKIVVISTGTDRVGLVVDQILGDYQTVIKPLSPFHAQVGSFSGATILGDGSVALILDVAALTAQAAHHDSGPLRAAG
jgi:two-component system chemotaxis sensor kinase CheA